MLDTLDVLSRKIEELKDTLSQLSESNIDEKANIQAQIFIIEECERVIDNEEMMSRYDFSNAIRLIESYNFSIENLSQIISDIQSVLLVREELNISSADMPLEDNQVSTFSNFIEKLKVLKEELNDKSQKLSENVESKKRISNLEALKNILEGTGRRKYYTEEMFRDFYEEFDILSLPPKQAQSLLERFYQTKNLSSRQSIEKANLEDVVALYREFLPSTTMKYFEALLNDHKNEVTTIVDFDNVRDILQFFKDNGTLEKFKKTTLLKITLYGKADYIKEVVYPKVMSNTPDVIETFYEDDLASIWIKEKGTSTHKSSPFRRSRTRREENDTESLYSSCHTIDYDEFWENIEILRANRSLFDDKFDIDDVGANLNIKTLPVWVLKKNIELCKIFGLGTITSIPPSSIEKGDIEDKVHLAIELGLLNPPLTPMFIEMDKDIIRNEEFQRNTTKKKIYNQSIRNYFQRYLSMLSIRSVNEYAYLFYKLKTEGYIAFYNDFFSDVQAGKGNPEIITPQIREVITDKKRMDDFVANNFMTDWYSDVIKNYDEYDDIITEYTDEEKKIEYKKQSYINSAILADPLIKELEENNTVMDTITQNDEVVERKNEFVYMFENRIISRYKVLHNASILKDMYGTLTKEMLMASIVRNSFIDNDTFQQIYLEVMERGRNL